MEAGLPNITGMFDGYGGPYQLGAFNAVSRSDGSYRCHAGTFNWGLHVDFDASIASNTYGNSDTVTPLSQSTLYVIKY